MTDDQTPIAALRARVAAFVAARDWAQFHSPKNLAMDIAVEAAELMEAYLWVDAIVWSRVRASARRLNRANQGRMHRDDAIQHATPSGGADSDRVRTRTRTRTRGSGLGDASIVKD